MFSKIRQVLPVLLLLLLTGCSSEEPTPTSVVIHQVGVTPSVQFTAAGWLRDYVDSSGRTNIDLRPMTFSYAEEALRENKLELILSASLPPEGWFATPLSTDALIFIVNPENPVRDLPLNTLLEIFTGRITSWEELDGSEQTIQLLVMPEGFDLRSVWESTSSDPLLPPATAMLAPSADAIIESVQTDPGAIGYVPFSAVEEETQGVQIISVDSIRPGPSTIKAGTYPILYQIIATAEEEPSGSVREWLAWVQLKQSEPD